MVDASHQTCTSACTCQRQPYGESPTCDTEGRTDRPSHPMPVVDHPTGDWSTDSEPFVPLLMSPRRYHDVTNLAGNCIV